MAIHPNSTEQKSRTPAPWDAGVRLFCGWGGGGVILGGGLWGGGVMLGGEGVFLDSLTLGGWGSIMDVVEIHTEIFP